MAGKRLVAAGALLAVMGACAQPGPAGEEAAVDATPAAVPSRAADDPASRVLPPGVAGAGRQAFEELRCTGCHEVAGESDFPPPVSDSRGPVLDARLSERPTADLVMAIASPSHSISVEISDELKERLADTTLSPMGDFSHAMSDQQLADVVAYLGSLETRGVE